MISTFQNTAKAKGQSIALFEEPDIVSYADKDVLHKLNQAVQQDPKYPLPFGYYKTNEKEITYSY